MRKIDEHAGPENAGTDVKGRVLRLARALGFVSNGPFVRLRSLETGDVYISFKVIREETCHWCGGTGKLGMTRCKCLNCDGIGKSYEEGGV